jgi:hypothetical protein
VDKDREEIQPQDGQEHQHREILEAHIHQVLMEVEVVVVLAVLVMNVLGQINQLVVMEEVH